MRFRKCLKHFSGAIAKLCLLSFITMNLIEFFQLKTNKNILRRSLRLRICPIEPPNLIGNIVIIPPANDFNAFTSIIETNYTVINGRWLPSHCRSRNRVAIILPYKDRANNLNYFLSHMHPFLQKQELEYQIFVVEQSNNDLFNKGVLMNAGFLEIMQLTAHNRTEFQMRNFTDYFFPFDCVIFHDVDLLPENDQVMYSCDINRPRHLSVAIDKFKYRMPYYKLIGGVLNFKPSDFISVNGYSNEYWGWGGEDDDMEKRLSAKKIGFERPDIKVARYSMIKHKERFKNPRRKYYLKYAINRYSVDGIFNVKYRVEDFIQHNLFTHYYIDVGPPPKYFIELANTQSTKGFNSTAFIPIKKLKKEK